jgi:hypothetical protein
MNIDYSSNQESIVNDVTLNENKETNQNNIQNQAPVKILKKRGRKPTSKVLDIQNIESKNITSSLNPEKECLILHLPLTSKDISKLNKKPDELNKENSIFIELSETQESEGVHNKEMTLTSELQITETSENKKKCYNCQYLTERCNALHQKLQEVSNIKNIQDSLTSKIHDCKIDIIDSDICKWKEKTDLWCWWCSHSFTNSPFGLPIKFENNKYSIQGCFCSLNCAKAYNIKENNYRTTEINSLIEDFRREIFGLNSYPVTLAPPRQSLKVYGGFLTIDEFRKEFYILNKNIIHLSPNIASVKNFFEEEYHDKIIRSSSNSDRPRLKRNTIPPQISYNLDKIMNNIEE